MIGEIIEEAGKAIASADRAVANAVADTIARDIPIPMPHIDVAVEDGHVTLHGIATYDLERSAAENAARRICGVRSVANRITNARWADRLTLHRRRCRCMPVTRSSA
jgi:osmotically-inducible protein OsmY